MPLVGLGHLETTDVIPRDSPVLIFFVGSMFRCVGVTEDWLRVFIHQPISPSNTDYYRVAAIAYETEQSCTKEPLSFV